MSEHGRDNSLDCLFSGQDGKIVNVKFFRGDDDLIAAEDLREEFVASFKRAKEARAKGEKSNVPKCRKAPLDLRKIVADIL